MSACVLGALLVTLPSLGLGFLLDDHVQRGFIESRLQAGAAGLRDVWDLFHVRAGGPDEIALKIRTGLLPWWTSSSFALRFFRPLAAASHVVDYALWPDSAVLMHAHNVLLYVLLVLLACALYLRFLPFWPAALASLFYAIDDAHAEGAAWIASRNTLLTSVFVLASLLCHDRARRGNAASVVRERDVDPARPAAAPSAQLSAAGAQPPSAAKEASSTKRFALLSALMLALALLSSEGGIAAWALLVPYACFIERGPLGSRLRALAPHAAVSSIWLLGYRLAGFGARGGDAYVDPAAAPSSFFLDRLPQTLPVHVAELLGIPYALSTHLPPRALPFAYALLLLALISLLVGLARPTRAMLFWLLAMLGCCIPIAAIGVTPRLLFLPSFAAFGLLAELMSRLQVAPSASRWRRSVSVVLCAPWLLLHGPIAAYGALHKPAELRAHERMFIDWSRSFPSGSSVRGKLFLLLNTPNYFVTAMAGVYQPQRGSPARTLVLNASSGRVRVERPDATSIIVEPEAGFLDDIFARVYRSTRQPFRPGQRIAQHTLLIEVLDVLPDGRPKRVRFTRAPLEDPRVLWGYFSAGRYRITQLPRVGEHLWLEP